MDKTIEQVHSILRREGTIAASRWIELIKEELHLDEFSARELFWKALDENIKFTTDNKVSIKQAEMNSFDLKVSLGDLVKHNIVVLAPPSSTAGRDVYRPRRYYHIRIEYFDFNYETVTSFEVIDNVIYAHVITEYNYDEKRELGGTIHQYNIRISKKLTQKDLE